MASNSYHTFNGKHRLGSQYIDISNIDHLGFQMWARIWSEVGYSTPLTMEATIFTLKITVFIHFIMTTYWLTIYTNNFLLYLLDLRNYTYHDFFKFCLVWIKIIWPIREMINYSLASTMALLYNSLCKQSCI